MIVRDILQKLQSTRLSYFLFGPRQTGKTTLVESLLDPGGSLRLDLLQAELFRELEARPESFREYVEGQPRNITTVFVDEVQRIPQLLNEVQWLMGRKNPRRFILSGSSARKLKRSGGNLLGGRAATFHLYPFTYREAAPFCHLRQLLLWGALPPVVFSEEKELVLKSYVDTYLKEEIQLELQIRNLSGFIRFLEMAARESGGLVNFASIAQDSQVKQHQAREFYQVLEDTLLGLRLEPFVSQRRRLAKHFKFYMFDTGVTRALNRSLAFEPVPGTPEFGRLFEQFLLLELVKINAYQSKNRRLYFYRSHAGAEVDFIVEKPDGGLLAVEAKANARPGSRGWRGLYSFREIVDSAELFCVHTGDRTWRQEDVVCMPWRDFLERMQDE